MAPVHEWTVAGAVLEHDGELLLVCNRRRNGSLDWSTPGGVIDATDDSVLDGLAREVEEETGLVVKEWADGPLYEVTAIALDLNWVMRCEVHRAVAFEGELTVDDPDGIVIDAAFVPADQIEARLGECFHWVREPLAAWVMERWEPPQRRGFRYEVRGTTLDSLEVVRADPGVTRTEASILHLDLDAFYASVEQLDDESLRGKPVIVGGLGNRGVVAAASYEAREFGVRSAVPMARARRACPQGVFLSPRFERYSEKSGEVMAVLRDVTPLVEPISLDEAFLDVAGARRSLGSGPEIARHLRTRIRTETGLTASVGVATTKLLAKLASDLSKPDGLLVVEPGTELAFLHPLPVTRLWGVGPATKKRLDDYGVDTVGDLADLPEATLVRALGQAAGSHLYALARNDDERAVEPDREMKSIGHEETFATDRTDRDGLERDALRMADAVAVRLRGTGKAARTVQLKLRYGDFRTITRSHTLPSPTDLTAEIGDTARDLLRAVDLGAGIRLLGVSVQQLEDGAAVQGVLSFDADAPQDAPAEDRRALDAALDTVREKFGRDAVGSAAFLERGRLRTGRRASLWGPEDGPETAAPEPDRPDPDER